MLSLTEASEAASPLGRGALPLRADTLLPVHTSTQVWFDDTSSSLLSLIKMRLQCKHVSVYTCNVFMGPKGDSVNALMIMNLQ